MKTFTVVFPLLLLKARSKFLSNSSFRSEIDICSLIETFVDPLNEQVSSEEAK